MMSGRIYVVLISVILLLLVLVTYMLIPSPAAAEERVFDIPPVDRIRIDGDPADWGERGFRVDLLPGPDGRFLPAEDFDARFRLGWNRGGLFVLVQVSDDVADEHQEEKRLWQKDCVEIFVADRKGSENLVQLVLAPGADERYGALRMKLYDHGGSGRDVRTVQAAEIVDNGYVMEVFIPCDSMGIDEVEGREFAFQLIAADSDGDRTGTFRAAWYPAIGAHEDRSLMHRVRFAGEASPPVTLHASRRAVMEGCAVRITAAAEETGSPYEIDCGTVKEKGNLSSMEGRTGAFFTTGHTGRDGMHPPVEVEVSGRTLARFGESVSMKHILDGYVEALGGRRRIEELESRRCLCTSGTEPVKHARIGKTDIRKEDDTRFEVTVDSEGRWLYRNLSSDPPETRGFDGAEGWIHDGNGVRREDISGFGVTVWWVDPRGPLRLDRYFDDLEVAEPTGEDGEDVYVIRGALPGGRHIRLVFDRSTHLLVKAGRLHFEEYRDEAGILLPHLVYFDSRNARTRFRMEEVSHDVHLDEGIFEMPDPAEAFPDVFGGIADERVLPMLKHLPFEHGGMNVPAADGRYLYDLIIEKGYRRGLEIGTSNGYSALWMGLAFRENGGELITIEYDRPAGLEAKQNFEKAGLDGVIDLRINDAFEEIPSIEGDFDFIFIDAWKPDYIRFLDLIRHRVEPGGVIAAHNVVAQERSMRDFLEAVQGDPDLETEFVETSSEGISVSFVKK